MHLAGYQTQLGRSPVTLIGLAGAWMKNLSQSKAASRGRRTMSEKPINPAVFPYPPGKRMSLGVSLAAIGELVAARVLTGDWSNPAAVRSFHGKDQFQVI